MSDKTKTGDIATSKPADNAVVESIDPFSSIIDVDTAWTDSSEQSKNVFGEVAARYFYKVKPPSKNAGKSMPLYVGPKILKQAYRIAQEQQAVIVSNPNQSQFKKLTKKEKRLKFNHSKDEAHQIQRTPIQRFGAAIRDLFTNPKEKVNVSVVVVNGIPYALLSVLGKGGFARAKVAQNLFNGTIVATKQILHDKSGIKKTKTDEKNTKYPGSSSNIDKDLFVEKAKNEARMTAKYFGTTVVNAAIRTEKSGDPTSHAEYYKSYLFMPLASRTLERDIELAAQPGVKASEQSIHANARELLTELSQLKQLGIVHNDIKPSNIAKIGGKYKLVDFGEAHDEGNPPTWKIGITPKYAADELYAARQSNFSCETKHDFDVHSMGLVLAELYGIEIEYRVPRISSNGHKQSHFVPKYRINGIADKTKAEIQKLIIAMTNPTTRRRPTGPEALKQFDKIISSRNQDQAENAATIPPTIDIQGAPETSESELDPTMGEPVSSPSTKSFNISQSSQDLSEVSAPSVKADDNPVNDNDGVVDSESQSVVMIPSTIHLPHIENGMAHSATIQTDSTGIDLNACAPLISEALADVWQGKKAFAIRESIDPQGHIHFKNLKGELTIAKQATGTVQFTVTKSATEGSSKPSLFQKPMSLENEAQILAKAIFASWQSSGRKSFALTDVTDEKIMKLLLKELSNEATLKKESKEFSAAITQVSTRDKKVTLNPEAISQYFPKHQTLSKY